MCEFCLDPSSRNRRHRKNNPDAFHSDFAGFFSGQAIEAALKQAAAVANVAAASSSKKRGNNKPGEGGEGDECGNDDDGADSDGT